MSRTILTDDFCRRNEAACRGIKYMTQAEQMKNNKGNTLVTPKNNVTFLLNKLRKESALKTMRMREAVIYGGTHPYPYKVDGKIPDIPRFRRNFYFRPDFDFSNDDDDSSFNDDFDDYPFFDDKDEDDNDDDDKNEREFFPVENFPRKKNLLAYARSPSTPSTSSVTTQRNSSYPSTFNTSPSTPNTLQSTSFLTKQRTRSFPTSPPQPLPDAEGSNETVFDEKRISRQPIFFGNTPDKTARGQNQVGSRNFNRDLPPQGP